MRHKITSSKFQILLDCSNFICEFFRKVRQCEALPDFTKLWIGLNLRGLNNRGNRGKGKEKTKFFPSPYPNNAGFSFVELIVTVAIFALVFGGLFGAFQLMTTLVEQSKAKAGALSMLSSKMEYIRSLPYHSVGTYGGVPAGNIQQHSTSTLNSIEYSRRVLIHYIDDVADGFGSDDSNGILSDYKQIKIEYTWAIRGKINKASLVSNIVPIGIESTAGGGTIRVNVFDAIALPVAGASVRFINSTTTPPIDTIRFTNFDGVADLSGAPAAANYEIITTHIGYSTDRTHVATTENPNPQTLPVSVLESQISTMNFQIDRLSNLLVRTVSPATYESFSDEFNDGLLIATTLNTEVSAGTLSLTHVSGIYSTSGTAQSINITPTTIESWHLFAFSANTIASTDVKVSLLYNNAGIMELVPDVDLPGNSLGFSHSPVDISSLNITSYRELALHATLSTSDTTVTPHLDNWGITHAVSQQSLQNVQLSIAGAKSIGTDSDSQPVLKYTDVGVSDTLGQWQQNDIEWDVYTILVTSPQFQIREICPMSPYSLNPNTSTEMKITLGSVSSHFLRVSVSNSDGVPIPHAAVQLQNTGVDELGDTSLCGQVYFNSVNLYTDDNYTLTVSATGFTAEVISNVIVDNDSEIHIILN